MMCLNRKSVLELPPRARRILNGGVFYRNIRGTTSACAENTAIGAQAAPYTRNYLRVRGEYPNTPIGNRRDRELPPRARRILLDESKIAIIIGTTSACAENTGREDCPG